MPHATRKTIQETLSTGTTLICDRYYHSGVVYSAAKHNPSLNLSWALAPERGLPCPDLVLFLDLDEETAKARGGWGNEIYEREEMQKRVKKLFKGDNSAIKAATQPQTASSTYPPAIDEGSDKIAGEAEWSKHRQNLVVLSADGSVEEVADVIWDKVQTTLAADNARFSSSIKTIV